MRDVRSPIIVWLVELEIFGRYSGIMRWSKLKQRIEQGFADSVRGRIEIWNTRYRAAHDDEGEAWITVDKARVHSMGSLTYLVASYEKSSQLQRERDCLDYRDDGKRAAYLACADEAEQDLASEGVIPLWTFNKSLFDYLNMSIDDVLRSDQTVLRALGMLDKRLGKRRLRQMDVSSEPELVQRFFQLRCVFEGIEPAAH
jgi:hypothetical protein